ncbi:MAG: NAD(P)-dependent oxidoreductase [Verrucomicrobiota bacterium]
MRQSQNHLFTLAARDLGEIVHLSAAELEALRGKRLFITGGTGFFGKWIVGALVHANAAMRLGLELMVLSRDPDTFAARHPEVDRVPELSLLPGDVSDFSAEEWDFDFILHAGADTTAFTREADERGRSRAIVEGTRNVLALARRCGARMLNVSSGAVYGAAAGSALGCGREGLRHRAGRDALRRGEARGGGAVRRLGADVVTARAFAFLGPHLPLDAHFAAGNFLRDAVRGGPILVRGDGHGAASYLHPIDLSCGCCASWCAARPGARTTSAPTRWCRRRSWRGSSAARSSRARRWSSSPRSRRVRRIFTCRPSRGRARSCGLV